MKSHEAEAIITLLRRTLAVNETGDTFTNINNDFYKKVVDEPEFKWPIEQAPTRDNDRWNYRWVAHPEAHLPGSLNHGRGKYWLFMEGAPQVYLANTNYEAQAQKICDALNNRTMYRRALDRIRMALVAYATDTRARPLETEGLLTVIRHCLTDPPPRRP